MKKFMVLYRAPISAQEQMASMRPEDRTALMQAWMGWQKRAGSAIVDQGAPLGERAHINGQPAAGHIGGFTILQAATIDGAKQLLEAHPHLGQPGFSIEVLEMMRTPGM